MVRVVHAIVEEALRELADEASQRQLWLSNGADGAEVSSYAECICHLWDDSGLSGELLDRKRGVYTPEIDDHLRELSALLNSIDANRSTKAILDNAKLAEARLMAAALLQELKDHAPATDDGAAP